MDYQISPSALIVNLNRLVETIDLKSLKPHLVENGVYSEYLLRLEIDGDSLPLTTQKQNLLFGLKKKTPQGLSNFVKSLIDAEQYEAVKILIPGFEEPPQKLRGFKEENALPLPSAGNVVSNQLPQANFNYPSSNYQHPPFVHKISAGQIEEPDEVTVWDLGEEVIAATLPELLDVKVKPAKQRYGGFHEKDCYRMESSPRGFAVIFVNEEFEGEPDMRRYGASTDKDLLVKLFKQLDYRVVVHENTSKKKMIDEIQTIVDSPDLKWMDSFVLVCSSHGEDDAIICSDTQHMSVSGMKQMFNNSNCPNLSGKPKLFIMQACRGGKMDDGVPNEDYKDGAPISKPPAYKPTVTDMLIAYSTTPGYAANRTGRGSWYIYLIADVFMKRAWNSRLDDMLMEVNRRMSMLRTQAGEKQAAETVWQGWHKKFYFNPGNDLTLK